MRRSSGDYSHASHIAKVISGSKARCGGRSVLFAMCQRAEFSRPEVTITKAQLQKMTGLARKAVQYGLAKLRDEGSIVPIAHFEGGSGHAVTYRLVALGQAQEAQIKPNARAEAVLSATSQFLSENPRLSYGEARAMAERSI